MERWTRKPSTERRNRHAYSHRQNKVSASWIFAETRRHRNNQTWNKIHEKQG